MIYEPAEDSYLLQKYVKELVRGKVLDMGTGSGVQALTALENTKEVIAVDVNAEAVDFVKKKGVNGIVSDLFDSVNGKFDWIIFNPPYLPEDQNEPEDSKLATTGGKKGSEVLEKFLKEAKDYLKPGGKILVLVSSLTGDPEVMFKDYKYECLEKKKVFFEELVVYKLEP